MAYKVIAVDVRRANPQEGLAGGDITPGMLIQPSGSNWVAHATSGGSSDFVADYLMESNISTDYENGDFMKYFSIREGDKFNAILTTSQTVAKGDKLVSNGDGHLKEASNGATAVGSATNYITFTPLNGNLVDVEFVDPSANTQSLDVTITGNYIKVSLATNGSGTITSTPALIKTAIEAVDGYSDLVSMVATGTAAVEADTASFQAEKGAYIADEAVTTVGSVARLRVMKGAV